MSAPGSAPVVVVAFYSRCGTTEALALSAAVGAVQARGFIRMRRLPDLDAGRTIETHPGCRETLVRMHKEYVAPKEADVTGADALVIGSPPGVGASAPEWREHLALLERLHAAGSLNGKVAAVIDTGDAATSEALSSALRRLGFALPEPAPPDAQDAKQRAIALGRLVVDAARKRA